MGYDLHITRRKRWTDRGDDITADEWQAYVRGDSELRLQPESGPSFAVWSGPSGLDDLWLDWSDGRIYTKNPDNALVDKMVAIAQQLDAAVQGDDGEIYERGGQAPRQQALSLSKRVAGWFARLRPQRPVKKQHEPLPFGVGDRVRDTWGNEHTVIRIDPQAEHSMGLIRTRRDDGTELGHAMIAHGLTPVQRKTGHDDANLACCDMIRIVQVGEPDKRV
jgi:hypothetical protein